MRNLLSLFLLAVLSLFPLSASASGARGTLVVHNQRDNEMIVAVDGGRLGVVPSSAELAFRLKTGAHDVSVRDNRSGEVVQQTRVVLGAGAVYTIVIPPSKAALEVRNGAGTTVRVSVNGSSSLELASGEARVLSLRPGQHAVSVTYRQLGRDRVLLTQQVALRGGDHQLIRLAPVDEGLVRVDNRTGRDATLVVDGRSMMRVPSGASVEAPTMLGRVSLSLVDNGRALASTSLAVGPYQDIIWRAEAPKTGDLLVQNPLPMPVLVQDSRGRVTTVAARSQARLLDLPVGHASLELRRATGEPLARLSAEVRPYDVSALTVPTPRDGLVAIINADNRPVSVYVDGVRTLSVAPRESARVLLSLGRHRVQIRDVSGRVVLDTGLVVDPFTTSTLSWGKGEPVAHAGHHDDRGHTEHQRPY